MGFFYVYISSLLVLKYLLKKSQVNDKWDKRKL